MKELTIYPRNEDGYFEHPDYGFRIADEDVDHWADDKRFTDAELLCEYWRYDRDVWNGLANMPKPPRVEDVEPAEEHDRRAEITLRFATLPHYDEEAPHVR